MREVAEEVGIDDVKKKDYIYLDTFKVQNNNNYHYKYVYLLKTKRKIEDFIMQKSEVSELFYVSLDNLKEMINENPNEITFSKQFYTSIILNKIEEIINK